MRQYTIRHIRSISNPPINGNNKAETKLNTSHTVKRKYSDEDPNNKNSNKQLLMKTSVKFGRGISYDKSVSSLSQTTKINSLPIITNAHFERSKENTGRGQNEDLSKKRRSVVGFASMKQSLLSNEGIDENSKGMVRNNSEKRFVKLLNKTKIGFGNNNHNILPGGLNSNQNNNVDNTPYKKKRLISFAMNSNHSFFTRIKKEQNTGILKHSDLDNLVDNSEQSNGTGPYGVKKKGTKSSASVFNVSKIIKLKEFHRNASTNNLESNTKVSQATPIKLKEKNNDEDIVKTYKTKSQAGKSEGGIPKTNQDSFLVKVDINGVKNFNMFGVLDGHGYNGHLASAFVTNFIKETISNHTEILKLKDLNEIYKKLKEDNYHIIKQTYIKAEQELTHAEFDCNFSGTTCVIVFQIGYHLICANAGDSRAVLVSRLGGMNKSEAIPLSKDHKPNIESERKRIVKSKGRVEQYCEFGIKSGPYRVWLKNEMYPGLAMSRSIGDLIASSVGVIPEPEITEYVINSFTRYIVIASDGVWEFLENEAVMKIANKYYDNNDAIGLCDTVVAESTKWWEKEDVVVDDITIVAVFF